MKLIFTFLMVAIVCWQSSAQIGKLNQDSIINIYLKNRAWNHHMYSQEYQDEIDNGLAVDSTIAYLWQQKAMPLFKQGYYESAMEFLDKAVRYDADRWQDYRAFMKCIFVKNYEEAIADFEHCKKANGNGYVMDHTYNFYMGLAYLQLDEFDKAQQLFKHDYDFILQNEGKGWLHHLDLFYYGVTLYELKKYEDAITLFDLALELYPQFSDVQYYKARCLELIGQLDEADQLFITAEENARAGYTINEDNVMYEKYPYQVDWHWQH